MMTDIIKSESGTEVNFLAIKDFAKVSIGEFVHKSKQNPSGKYPVYNGGTGNTGFYDEYNRTANKIIVSARGANAGYVNRVFVDFWSGNSCYSIDVIDENVDWNYIYYCLKNGEVKLLGEQQKGGIPAVSKKQVEQFKIPLPPLPIQQEIVRILDTFTNLTAELTAELTARRKQYEYYRDELLKTGEQVSLYEVAQYSKDRILASELTDENYVGVDNLLPNKQGKIKSEHTPIEGKFTGFVKGDILIGNIRPYLKKIWFSDCVGGTNGDVLTIRVIDKERVLPRFLYFALSTESFFNYDMNNAKGAKMPRGDKKAVMNYQFYLPSLEIQEKVVSILETFDNLCNGFEYGLPAEIYARQQQYEYYRDELLNFKELHNKED